MPIIIFEQDCTVKYIFGICKGYKKSRADININILIMALFSSGIKKPAYAGFFMAPNSIVENGARGRTRTGTL
ncbi:hypothetical protein NSY32_01975 [Acinetobacter baumannii]|nr:hypothetical protein [Acinetobacter baumannii]